MKLVSHANLWHRLWSIRLGILTAALKGADVAYRNMHADWAAHLPGWLLGGLGWASLATGAAATAAVLIQQQSLNSTDTITPTVPENQA
ncbi:hypothetical protein CH75_06435 [Dyella jiangningensis]|nr:hypothetical protein CH75_06435 [Dyella jiangningensis]